METGKQQSEHVGYSIENFNNCENIPEGAKVAFFTYGRFQPGHRGHEKMIMTLLDVAMKHNLRTGINITPEKTNVYVLYLQVEDQQKKNQTKILFLLTKK